MLVRLILVAALVTAVSAQTVDSSRDALFAAIRRGATRDVERLIANGASPNVKDAQGTPALMWAVPNRDKIQHLLDRRAAVDAKSDTGRTALLVAASYPGTVDLLRLLL